MTEKAPIEEKQWVCPHPDCGKQSTSKDGLRMHIYTYHDNDSLGLFGEKKKTVPGYKEARGKKLKRPGAVPRKVTVGARAKKAQADRRNGHVAIDDDSEPASIRFCPHCGEDLAAIGYAISMVKKMKGGAS